MIWEDSLQAYFIGHLKVVIKKSLLGEVGTNDQCRKSLHQGDLRQAIFYARQLSKDLRQEKLAEWLKQAEHRLEREEALKVLETYTDQMIKQVK